MIINLHVVVQDNKNDEVDGYRKNIEVPFGFVPYRGMNICEEDVVLELSSVIYNISNGQFYCRIFEHNESGETDSWKFLLKDGWFRVSKYDNTHEPEYPEFLPIQLGI